jgi:hypothetical protein
VIVTTDLAVIVKAANTRGCALLAALAALLAAILEALNACGLFATTAPDLETLVAGLHAAIAVIQLRITLALELKTLSAAPKRLEAWLTHWAITALAHVSALAADATLTYATVVHVHVPGSVAVAALAERFGILATGWALGSGLHIGDLVERIIRILLLLSEHAGTTGGYTTLARDHLIRIDRIATERAVWSVLVERLILIIRIRIRITIGSLTRQERVDAASCRFSISEVHCTRWSGCSTVSSLEGRRAILTILLFGIDLILDSDACNGLFDGGLMSRAHDAGEL